MSTYIDINKYTYTYGDEYAGPDDRLLGNDLQISMYIFRIKTTSLMKPWLDGRLA
jgi:hypothetical protein